MAARSTLTNAVQARDKTRNPLVALIAEGQSVWLDNLTREIVSWTGAPEVDRAGWSARDDFQPDHLSKGDCGGQCV